MDNERLIFEVSKHEALYDCKHKHYFDSDYRNNLWTQIAKILNSTAEMCKNRFRNLRTSFVNELRKGSKGNSSNKKWIYYEQMLFLLPYVQYRRILRNMPTFENSLERPCNDYDFENSQHPESIEDSKDYINLTDDFVDPEPDTVGRSEPERANEINSEFQSASVDADDPLQLFFMTMYKTVKKFPPHLQITAKRIIFGEVTNIEEKLQESSYYYSHSSTSNTNPPSRID